MLVAEYDKDSCVFNEPRRPMFSHVSRSFLPSNMPTTTPIISHAFHARQNVRQPPPLTTEVYAAILSSNPEDAHIHSLVSQRFRRISSATLWKDVTVYYVSEDDTYSFDSDPTIGHPMRNGGTAYWLFGHAERSRIQLGVRPRLRTLHDFWSFLQCSPHIRCHIRSLRLSARLYTVHPIEIYDDPMEHVHACPAKLQTLVNALELLPNLADLHLTNFLFDDRPQGNLIPSTVPLPMRNIYEIQSLTIDVHSVHCDNWDMKGVARILTMFKSQKLHLFLDVPTYPW